MIGQSAHNPGEPASEPETIRNLLGTVLHPLLEVGKVRVLRGIPREVLTMTDYAPVPAATRAVTSARGRTGW